MKHKKSEQLYKQFLQKRQRNRSYVFATQLIILIIFIVLWELCSRFYIIDPLIFSSPTKVVQLIGEKYLDRSLLYHLQYTIFETILGFIIGTVAGIILASILWSSKT